MVQRVQKAFGDRPGGLILPDLGANRHADPMPCVPSCRVAKLSSCSIPSARPGHVCMVLARKQKTPPWELQQLQHIFGVLHISSGHSHDAVTTLSAPCAGIAGIAVLDMKMPRCKTRRGLRHSPQPSAELIGNTTIPHLATGRRLHLGAVVIGLPCATEFPIGNKRPGETAEQGGQRQSDRPQLSKRVRCPCYSGTA